MGIEFFLFIYNSFLVVVGITLILGANILTCTARVLCLVMVITSLVMVFARNHSQQFGHCWGPNW